MDSYQALIWCFSWGNFAYFGLPSKDSFDKKDSHLEFLLFLLLQLTNKICWFSVLWLSQYNQGPSRFCKNLIRGTEALAWLKKPAAQAFSFQVYGRRKFFVSNTDYCVCHKIMKLKNMQNCKGSDGSRMGSSHCCTLMYFWLSWMIT